MDGRAGGGQNFCDICLRGRAKKLLRGGGWEDFERWLRKVRNMNVLLSDWGRTAE